MRCTRAERMTQPRSSRPFLQAALNGDRMHPAAPHTRADLGRGAGRGGIRTGLEDTPVLPDGRLADGNGDLVAAAAAMLADSAPE